MILDLTGTREFFASVVSAEDTQRGKPDPQVFQLAADRLAVRPEQCVVFEDAVAGSKPPRAAGMRCVAVRFVGHHPAEKLTAAGASRVVESLADVAAPDVARLLDVS